jgi:hypothetical protein
MGTSYAYAGTGVEKAGIAPVVVSGKGLKLSDPRISMMSKKVVFFEPPLHADNGPKSAWHSTNYAYCVSFLDGHSEFVKPESTAAIDASSISNRYYY